MTDPALQALLDKLQIAELLTRYLRSVDRGDIDTLRACYLPGATEDHGGQLVWDWNHDAPEEEHWMRGLLAPDPSVLRLSGKFPADPVYAPR